LLCCIWTLLLLTSACGGSEQGAPAADPAEKAAAPAPVAQAAPSEPRRGPPLGIGEPLAPSPFTLEQRYLEAARQGDLPTLERALERGVDVNAKDDLQRTALLLAVRDAGSLEALLFLESRGARIDEPDAGGRTALSWASGAGRLALVKQLASKGALIDQPDMEQRRPLFHAVAGEHPEVVVWLLDAGAKVNAADQFGDTPLMLACAKGYGDLAALLLARGADPALRNQEGRTAGDRAAAGAEVCRAPART
jgi:ankyrin repeat protein